MLDDQNWRGVEENVGQNLKSMGWWNGGNPGTDSYGFGGLPGGERNFFGPFYGAGTGGVWWTSSFFIDVFSWNRSLVAENDGIRRAGGFWKGGFSVRCVQGEDGED